jgi:hypothetical protein
VATGDRWIKVECVGALYTKQYNIATCSNTSSCSASTLALPNCAVSVAATMSISAKSPTRHQRCASAQTYPCQALSV